MNIKFEIKKFLDNKKLVYSVAAAVSVLLIAALFFALLPDKASEDKTKNSKDKKGIELNFVKEDKVRRLIDGVLVEKDKENPFLFAVMIDNHADARPPAGLDKASLVYEVEAEGRITRYLALFNSFSEIEEIGPIRSARPYFLDIAKEYGALYAHVGGSPEALVKIRQDNILDINEFYNEHYFWRDQARFAPHNVLSSNELLNKYVKDRDIDVELKYFAWQYRDEASMDNRPDRGLIKIGYKLLGYDVEWRYDKQNNVYSRYIGGNAHKTANGNYIEAKNITIQVIPAEVIDNELRIEMDIVGEGEAQVCNNGVCSLGTWEKKNALARTRFYNDSGEELNFVPGVTWVEIVRPDVEVYIE